MENAPNRQNSQAGLTGFGARYQHTVGAVELTLSGNLADSLVGTPGQLGFFSPTSEQGSINRNLQLQAQIHGQRSVASLQLGASSADLSYTCNTPVDSNCPNSFYPTPSPGSSSNPPYAQMLYDQHAMASLRDVVGDARQRLVYGVDLMRGDARVDGGTGGGSPSAADNAPVFDAYAQTAAYMQSQWFAANGDQIYAGLRGERDGGLGGAYSPSIGGIVHLAGPLQLRLNAATAFRAPTAEELYYPGFSNPNLAPERTRVGDATLADPALWGGVSLGWFTTSGSNLIVSPPPYLHSGKRRTRVDSRHHARRPDAAVARPRRKPRGHEPLSRAGSRYANASAGARTSLCGNGRAAVSRARREAASTALQSKRERKGRRRRRIRFYRRHTPRTNRRHSRRLTRTPAIV